MTPKQIKELRRKNNLSQHKLAKKLGRTQIAISRWERGQLEPKEKDKKRMACIFGIEYVPKKPKSIRKIPYVEIEEKRKARRVLLNKLDRKYDGSLRDVPEDDEDLIAFRKLLGVKRKRGNKSEDFRIYSR